MSQSGNQKTRERSDFKFKGVFWFLMALSFFTLGSAVVVYFMHLAFLRFDAPRRAPVSPTAQYHRLPPEPRLQIDDAADLVEFKKAEDAILNSYGWLDPQAGKVRLPIDRALELTAERGLPSRKGSSQK